MPRRTYNPRARRRRPVHQHIDIQRILFELQAWRYRPTERGTR